MVKLYSVWFFFQDPVWVRTKTMFDKKAEEAKRLLDSGCYQWNELAIFLTLNLKLLGSSWSDICKNSFYDQD